MNTLLVGQTVDGYLFGEREMGGFYEPWRVMSA
jgi:hypothetical protein